MFLRLFCIVFLLVPTLLAATPMSLESLTKLRSVKHVSLSPDGDHIAYLVSRPRRLGDDQSGKNWSELYVLDGKGNVRPFITGGNYLASLKWDAESRHLWFLAKLRGDEFFSLYQMPISGGEARKVVSHKNNVLGFNLDETGQKILFWAKQPFNSNKQENLKSEKTAWVFEEEVQNNHLWSFDLNHPAKEPIKLIGDRHIVFAQFVSDTQSIVLKSAPSGLIDDVIMRQSVELISTKGQLLRRIEHQGKLDKIQVSPNGKSLAMIGSNDLHAPDFGELLIADLATGKSQNILQDFEGQVLDINWLSNRQIGFVAQIGTGAIVARKRANRPANSYKLLAKTSVIFTKLSASQKGDKIALLGHHPSYPAEVHWLTDKKAVRVTDHNEWLKNTELAEQEVVKYQARDGLELEGVLVKPLSPSEKPAPLIIFAHGGPEAHFSNGWLERYSHPAHYAATKGFYSFFPNYRGSTGKGTAFTKLGQKDYAGKEFQDLLDAKHHLVQEYAIDAKRVGITGVSYGGYAAAWGATAQSKQFAASVMLAGISNNISKFGTTDIPTEMIQVHALQYPWEDWQHYLTTSPIYYSDKHRTPLLIAHGLEDTRVHPAQSLEIYRHLKSRAQAPVRLVLYPDQGHGQGTIASQYDYSSRMMRWMEHFLIDSKTSLPPIDLN